MNRYCTTLFNSLLTRELYSNNIRVLSTILQYSLFDKTNFYTFYNKNEKFIQIRYLGRDIPKKKDPSLKKNSKSQPKDINSQKQRLFKQNLKQDNKEIKIDQNDLFRPLEVKPISNFDEDIGLELGGRIEKSDINKVLVSFRQDEKVLALANESGLNTRMFNDVLLSFRRFCLQSKALPPDLHIKLSDIIKNAANQTDLFPYFLRHAHELFPHLNCMEDLKHISDLTEPSFWYVDTREIKRKIIYHAGPTNSGKTYSALKRFQESNSGIYCGPLKLLANEVYIKTNSVGRKCDLVTGEERKFGDESGKASDHIACTVEMANLEKTYDVAIIDEIQMIRDHQRGWAWTRALLGIKAKEIHVCGDLSASDLISDLSFLTGDGFELRTYERLTPLKIMNKALESYDNVEPGDCFVCFNKNDIYNVLNHLEARGYEVAVIYGSMPPGVKLAQAARFNDPNDKCKILVATDAIGMGLNLNIRRVIFYSLKKVQQKEAKLDTDSTNNNKESSEIENITTSQALQIAGRAGRFNTAFKDGYVTTFTSKDLPLLIDILKQPLEKTSKAGLHPTAEQIELFAYHLPNHSLSDLLKIFMSICKIDNGQYFLCNFGEIVYLAEMIDHIPIKLRAKYTFATSPINRKQTFVCICFVKFVRYYSNNEVVTDEALKKMIEWPFNVPKNVNEVAHLETVYDVLDLYLWLAYRFPDIFSYIEEVKRMRVELEQIIYEGVKNVSLLNQSSNQTRHVINRRHKKIETQNLSQINNMFSTINTTNSQESKKKLSNETDQALKTNLQQNEDLNENSFQFSDEQNYNNLNKNLNKNNEIHLKSKYERLVDFLKLSKNNTKKDSTKSKKQQITKLDIEAKKSVKETFKNLLDNGAIELSIKNMENDSKRLEGTQSTSKKLNDNIDLSLKKVLNIKKLSEY